MMRGIKPGDYGLDTRALSVFRILCGFIIAFDFWERWTLWRFFLSDAGLYPRVLALRHAHYWSSPWVLELAMVSGSGLGVALFMMASLSAAVSFALGYRTKLSGWLCWFALMALHYRTPLTVHAGDVLLRCVLFFANFMPLAEHLSVDAGLGAWTSRQRLKCDPAFHEKSKSAAAPPLLWFGVAALAYQLQVASLYFWSAVEKTGPSWVSDYSALELALSQPFFSTWMGSFVAHRLPRLLGIATLLIVKWEFFAPLTLLLPLPRVRSFFVITASLLHLGIRACMRVDLLVWVPLVALVPLIPSMFWDWLLEYFQERPRKRAPVILRVDLDFWFSSRIAFWLHTFVLPARVQVAWAHLDGPEGECGDGAWLTVARESPQHDGIDNVLINSAALEELFLQSPLPLLWLVSRWVHYFAGKIDTLAGQKWLVALRDEESPLRFKRAVSSARKVSAAPLAVANQVVEWTRLKQVQQVFLTCIVVAAALFVIRHNWHVARGGSPQYGALWNSIGAVAGLHQRWDMFAPDPRQDFFWLSLEGRTKNDAGEPVVLYAGQGEGSIFDFQTDVAWNGFSQPLNMGEFFGYSQRVFKYFEVGYLADLEGVRDQFAGFVCREWGVMRAPESALSVKGVFRSLSKADNVDARSSLLWQGSCASALSGLSPTSSSSSQSPTTTSATPLLEETTSPLMQEIASLRTLLAQKESENVQAWERSKQCSLSLSAVKMQLEVHKKSVTEQGGADTLEQAQMQSRLPRLRDSVGENIDRRPPWENIVTPDWSNQSKADSKLLSKLADAWMNPVGPKETLPPSSPTTDTSEAATPTLDEEKATKTPLVKQHRAEVNKLAQAKAKGKWRRGKWVPTIE